MDAQVRRLVRERAGNRCEYCRLLQHAAPFWRFQVEHIRARQHGGVGPLMAAAADAKTERSVRCNAIGSLGQMRAADAADLMEKLLTDPDASTNAAIALYRISGKKTKQLPEGYRLD